MFMSVRSTFVVAQYQLLNPNLHLLPIEICQFLVSSHPFPRDIFAVFFAFNAESSENHGLYTETVATVAMFIYLLYK
jgi:hypothetical protein